MISYGADNYEKEQIMDNINHEWDKIVILSPYDEKKYLEF